MIERQSQSINHDTIANYLKRRSSQLRGSPAIWRERDIMNTNTYIYTFKSEFGGIITVAFESNGINIGNDAAISLGKKMGANSAAYLSAKTLAAITKSDIEDFGDGLVSLEFNNGVNFNFDIIDITKLS